MQCRIDDLPDELLEYILSLIPPYKDLQECKLVSKRWFRATKNVIEHNEAHFRKAVSFGALFWSLWPKKTRMPTISKRHSHSACIYENSMYVFGGCTATSTTFNDLWRLDLDTRTWVRPITMGSYPSPKACATMLYYKKNFVLFGGWSYPSRYPLHQQWKLFNELHVYSIETNKWNAINTLEAPPPMSAHSATIHGNNMVVFGGIHCGLRSNDLWCLNLDTYSWHKQATAIIKPRPRYGQSQIHLGDKHILVLGGCTGPNAAMNDAWLLNMTEPTWKWKKVILYHPEWAPARIWCHQACKVGNYIVVLSNNKRHAKVNDMSIAMKNVACQRPSRLPDVSPLQESKQRHRADIDTDENVNGRHGSFSRSPSQSRMSNPPSRKSNFSKIVPFCCDSALSMAAFRDKPTNNNLSINRQRQLEYLKKMEEKIRSRKIQTKVAKRTENTLSIFILDISKVLCDECSASWVPLKEIDQSGPDERILYSLVMGRGELIVFGGIRKEQTTMQSQPDVDDLEVYNDLHFINPPKYVI
ncbi:F-box only protein 42 isoform X1 [Vespula maculifrons]|uniref:F-box only protein 42 isoform X1 n=1 Tax=Vespula maculifrons TaxID=7453 RepID=A0ABD2D001_VESMC|nr:F-box only protein 42 [Vespula vulgaris]XP_050862943.1 F-box only protein 42 [Vespula vulgaris]